MNRLAATAKRGRRRATLLDLLKHRDDRIGQMCDFYEARLAQDTHGPGAKTRAAEAAAKKSHMTIRTVQRHLRVTLPALQTQREYFANRDRELAISMEARAGLAPFFEAHELEWFSLLPSDLLLKLADRCVELQKLRQASMTRKPPQGAIS